MFGWIVERINHAYWRMNAHVDGVGDSPDWDEAPAWATRATLVQDPVYGGKFYRWAYYNEQGRSIPGRRVELEEEIDYCTMHYLSRPTREEAKDDTD